MRKKNKSSICLQSKEDDTGFHLNYVMSNAFGDLNTTFNIFEKQVSLVKILDFISLICNNFHIFMNIFY